MELYKIGDPKNFTIEGGVLKKIEPDTGSPEYIRYREGLRSPLDEGWEVTVPGGVTEIGGHVLGYFDKTRHIILPDSLRVIGDDAFYGNYTDGDITRLEYISIPSGVVRIGARAFSGCANLIDIEIPDSVTEIGEEAFSWCTGLRNIRLSGSISEIRRKTLSSCYGLTRIRIPEGVTEIGESALSDCRSLTEVTLPNSLVRIRGYAFAWCGRLTTVNLPEGLTQIDPNAFSGCDMIPREDRNAILAISRDAFYDYDKYQRALSRRKGSEEE